MNEFLEKNECHCTAYVCLDGFSVEPELQERVPVRQGNLIGVREFSSLVLDDNIKICYTWEMVLHRQYSVQFGDRLSLPKSATSEMASAALCLPVCFCSLPYVSIDLQIAVQWICS